MLQPVHTQQEVIRQPVSSEKKKKGLSDRHSVCVSEPDVTREKRPMILILDHSFDLDLVRPYPFTIKKKNH